MNKKDNIKTDPVKEQIFVSEIEPEESFIEKLKNIISQNRLAF